MKGARGRNSSVSAPRYNSVVYMPYRGFLDTIIRAKPKANSTPEASKEGGCLCFRKSPGALCMTDTRARLATPSRRRLQAGYGSMKEVPHLPFPIPMTCFPQCPASGTYTTPHPQKGSAHTCSLPRPPPSSTTTDLGERKAVTSRLYHAMRWNKYRYPRYVNDHNLAFFLNMKKKDLENLCDFVIYRPCVARKPWIFPRRRFFFSFPSRLPPPLDNHSLGSLAYNYAASFFPSFFSRLSCD